LKSGHGGKRAGAGKPKGHKAKSTIAKEVAREALRQIVLQRMESLLSAQIAHAEGLKYLVARHKTTGKFAKLTEELMTAIAAGQNPEYEAIEVWSKDPSVQAFTDLMNRAIDKPADHVEMSGKDGGPLEIVVRKPW
jgi:hypothetical protein